MVEDMVCLEEKIDEVPHIRKGNWQRPDPGWCKVNTDASFVASSGLGSGGAVTRDSDGKVLQAAAKIYEHVPDVLMAQALAARDGVLLARACGLGKMILETDNLHLSNLLRSQAGERSPIAGLWQEIMEIGRNFSCFQKFHL
jgi:hypothetical protein